MFILLLIFFQWQKYCGTFSYPVSNFIRWIFRNVHTVRETMQIWCCARRLCKTVIILIPTNSVYVPHLPLHIIISIYFNLCQFASWKNSTVVLICISLILNKVEQGLLCELDFTFLLSVSIFLFVFLIIQIVWIYR